MKKILITGANSYIGTSFKKYIKENYPNDYTVDTVDMIDGSWREKSFAGYDIAFHVAGIAHQKETKKNAHLYYEINRDLAVETAKKAKDDGVRQFIFLSSMSVYGLDIGVITKDTVPNPKTNYGKSKWEAEQRISELATDSFCVSILRPPMVYGEGCKGNYQTLSVIAKKVSIFPYVNNRRSMLYIDNLCEFVHLLIKYKDDGVFCPQNAEYINTSEMVAMIASTNGKRLYLVKGFGGAIKLMGCFCKKVRKAFGSLYYEDTMNKVVTDYIVVDYKSSIIATNK